MWNMISTNYRNKLVDIHYRSSFIIFATFFQSRFKGAHPEERDKKHSTISTRHSFGWRNDSSEINSSSITLQIYKKNIDNISSAQQSATGMPLLFLALCRTLEPFLCVCVWGERPSSREDGAMSAVHQVWSNPWLTYNALGLTYNALRKRAQQECHCCFLHYVGRLNLSCVCVFEVNGQALVRTVQCLPYIKSDQTHG